MRKTKHQQYLAKIPVEHLEKIGRNGGLATVRSKGKKFFSKISKKRKHFRGGRPRKDAKKVE